MGKNLALIVSAESRTKVSDTAIISLNITITCYPETLVVYSQTQLFKLCTHSYI